MSRCVNRSLILPFLWLLLVSLANPSYLISQDVEKSESGDVISVELNDERIVDRGRGMTQVYLLSDEDQIHNMGVAETIVKPREIDEAEIAYFRVYFAGRKGKFEKAIFVLVADFRSENPKYFIDQNGNLDFTDDQKTEPIKCEDGSIILVLSGDEKDSKFSLQLMPFRNDDDLTDESKARYVQLFDGLREAMGGKFVDADYWYFNRRLNTRTSSVEIDGRKVMLGLHDYDCDGHYNGERDRLLVGEFGAENISYRLADGAINTIPNEIFLIDETPYRFSSASADGTQLQIEKSDVMPERLFVGMEVPQLELKRFDGETVELQSLIEPEKLLVLDFWGQWCAPCLEAIPSSIEFHEKWNEKVVMVGVHMGDHEIARSITDEKKVPWHQFESSDQLQEIFFIDAWPTYIVIDDQGKLVSFRSSLKEIAELLEK